MDDDNTPHILIIKAAFYKDIAGHLEEGAGGYLKRAGASFDVVEVPGALEIPIALKAAIEAGLFAPAPGKTRYRGLVALGCVIRGETSHYDIVAGDSTRCTIDLAIDHNIPLGNGVLTVENKDQALKRARPDERNKGAGAAQACLELVALKAHFQSLS